MYNKILFFLSMMMNFLFLNFNNPLIMMIVMLIQAMLIMMMMGKIYYSFWFSYIIFLIFIGGLFILFIYMISLTFNNKYMIYSKYLMINFIIFFFFLLLLNNKMNFINNYEIMNLKIMNLFKENNLMLIKFFNFPNNLINLMMIIYLFILMIMVVKITDFYKGPLRMMKKYILL